MCIDKKLQCKTTFQDYELWHIKRIIPKLTPEAKQQVLEHIQARIVLGGEQPVNQEAYVQAIRLLKGEGNGRRESISQGE